MTEQADSLAYLESKTQAEAACKVFTDWAEPLVAEYDPLMKTVTQALSALGKALVAEMDPFMKTLAEWLHCFYVSLQRAQLEVILLRRWHLPHRLAGFVTEHCPQPWLPELDVDAWSEAYNEGG